MQIDLENMTISYDEYSYETVQEYTQSLSFKIDEDAVYYEEE